jgi:hypothetical protein
MYQSFQDKTYTNFQINDYKPCLPENGSCYHRANLILVSVANHNHNIVLVRLDHPSHGHKIDAGWLLEQHDFRKFVGLRK